MGCWITPLRSLIKMRWRYSNWESNSESWRYKSHALPIMLFELLILGLGIKVSSEEFIDLLWKLKLRMELRIVTSWITNYAILAGLSENYYKLWTWDDLGKCICYESCNWEWECWRSRRIIWECLALILSISSIGFSSLSSNGKS